MDDGRSCTEDLEGWQARFPEGLYLQAGLRRVRISVSQSSVSYRPPFVVADDGEVIALCHVESLNLVRSSQQELFDKLKDDCLINIRTVSGKAYIISMQSQIKSIGEQYNLGNDPLELRDDIFGQWLQIITNN